MAQKRAIGRDQQHVSDRKKDLVKTYLRDRLTRGEYRFGQKLSAKAVSEETDASRFMVITAINELQAEGFFDVTAQVGVTVTNPSLTEIMDFFVVFGRLEGALAEFAAQRREPTDISRLRWINEQLHNLDMDDIQSGEGYRTINLEFHEAVHAAAKSPKLAQRQLLQWSMADFFVTQASDFRSHVPDSATEHDLVVTAIERKDGETARTLMESHIRRLGQDVVANLSLQISSPEVVS